MAESIGRSFSDNISKVPMLYAQYLTAFDFEIGPSYEIVIAGNHNDESAHQMLNAARSVFIPNKVILFKSPDLSAELAVIAPFTEHQIMKNGKATAYVCQNFTCSAPTNEVEEMMKLLTLY